MIKRISVWGLILVLIVSLTGCGISREDFISSVKNYKIFEDSNTDDDMETISDFIKKVESFDESNEEMLSMISTSWSEENIKEDNELIQKLEQNNNFIYDNKKYYGKLSINFRIASAVDYSTKEYVTHDYLFSLDKEGNVIPEGCGIYYGEMIDYKETKISDIGLDMEGFILLIELEKEYYTES